MVSLDLQIRRSAGRSRERWEYQATIAGTPEGDALRDLLLKQDLEELREYLAAEVYNMQERLRDVLHVYGRIKDRRPFVKHLHLLTYDETYRDYAPSTKSYRTRKRIEALLELCHGDESLLVREYRRALEQQFPVSTWSSHYEWNPKLLKVLVSVGRSGRKMKQRRTIRFHMRRRLQSD